MNSRASNLEDKHEQNMNVNENEADLEKHLGQRTFYQAHPGSADIAP